MSSSPANWFSRCSRFISSVSSGVLSWAIDVIHIHCGVDGWGHLAAVIDCHDREIVGYEFALRGRAREAEVCPGGRSADCGLQLCGAVSEILQDSVNGSIVSTTDPVALASRVLRLLDDVQLRERFVTCARQQVEKKFTIEENAKKMASVE